MTRVMLAFLIVLLFAAPMMPNVVPSDSDSDRLTKRPKFSSVVVPFHGSSGSGDSDVDSDGKLSEGEESDIGESEPDGESLGDDSDISSDGEEPDTDDEKFIASDSE
eukprot:NODE_82_length_22625_cov_0.476516.p18 type:complete len:107 gc:universal NODE_82_length_22625_cov_0.476516:14111-14431(+)